MDLIPKDILEAMKAWLLSLAGFRAFDRADLVAFCDDHGRT